MGRGSTAREPNGAGNRTARLVYPHRGLGACTDVRGPLRPYRQCMFASSLPISPRATKQIGVFLGAYLLYSAARWITVGDLGAAQAHAEWIMRLERHLGVATEASVQQA